MKFWLKRNWKYIVVLMICLITMLYGVLEELNFFNIMKMALFEPGYKENFFLHQENAALWSVDPTIWNIAKTVVSEGYFVFDVSLIFGTMWFQIIIPLFATISGIVFYQHYNSIMQMSTVREKKSYRVMMLKHILFNSLKLAGTIFAAYLVFMIIMKCISMPGEHGADERSLFADLLESGFYLKHTALYFILEGFVRFFLIPFAYASLAQSVVLLGRNLKEVVAAPILYYYGLAAIGYALVSIAPVAAIYINPSVIMASGSYDGFHSLVLILINLIPLYIAIGIICWRTKDVQI